MRSRFAGLLPLRAGTLPLVCGEKQVF